jgi:predicted DNA-binding ribbon-helix-helix protein
MSHRTQITLTDGQYELLRAVSRDRGVGLAELIRRAVDRTYGRGDGEDLLSALDASFGSWRDSDDGVGYVEALRPGMARRLADRAG